MNSSNPLLPSVKPRDQSYKCTEETVKLCFDGQADYCSGFFLRSGMCVIQGIPLTLINGAYTAAGNTDGVWISLWGVAMGVAQIATGIFCEHIHKPFNAKHCGYSCFNDFNIIMGSVIGAINLGLLIYQEIEQG